MALVRKNQAADNESHSTDHESQETKMKDESQNKEVVASKSTERTVATAKPASCGAFIESPELQELAMEADFGDFASIIASNGTHLLKTTSGKENLGETIEFQAIVARPVWKVSTGSTDDEAKEFFKVSYDGEVCTDGTSVEDAKQDAIEAGYEKAKIAEGVDVYILIRKCEKDPSQEGEVRVLQLSPSSRRNWSPLEKKVRARAALGTLKAEPIREGSEYSAVRFKSTSTLTSWKGNDYTVLEFDLV